ncbi:MAG: hypothetical protein KDD33_07655 [Bdellovibrionales bacterium]|nr:hypothetical protein [Bdellovibrionales bacterium]
MTLKRVFPLSVGLIFFLLGSSALASLKITSFYEADALVTGRFLPFKVSDSGNLKIKSVVVDSGCRAMLDPYRKDIFLVYCWEEGSPSVDLVLDVDGHEVATSAPAIAVAKVSIIEPPDDPVGPGGESLGFKLFKQDCTQCHPGQKVITKGQTANSVRTALARGQMKSINLDLKYNADDEKINALVKYINEEM